MAPHPIFGEITEEGISLSLWMRGRQMLETRDLQVGVSIWEALYHYVDKVKAAELYDLVLGGYDDGTLIDPDWWPEERAAFETAAYRLRLRLIDLQGPLWRKLRLGQVVAFGYSNLAPLDAGRQQIRAGRWQDLVFDLKNSTASGPGIEITQILIYPAEPPNLDTGNPAARGYSEAALRRWYLARVESRVGGGRQPSREEDHRDANAAFGGSVPKRTVEALRRALAPEAWKRKGRRRGPGKE